MNKSKEHTTHWHTNTCKHTADKGFVSKETTQTRLLKLGKGLKGQQAKEGTRRAHRMMPSTEGLRNTV